MITRENQQLKQQKMGAEASLVKAVESNDEKSLDQLLSTPAATNSISKNIWEPGQSPLHLAAHLGRVRMIRKLVEAGADVNSYVVDAKRKGTALHYAVTGNQLTAVRALLELGADFRLEGHWKHLIGTPLDFAGIKKSPMLEQLEIIFVEATDGKRRNSPEQTTKYDLPTMIQKVKSKPILELQLKLASEIQDQIHKHQFKLEFHKDRIEELRANPGFRDSTKIKSLSKELEEIDALEAAIKDAKEAAKNNKANENATEECDENTNCPICMISPEEVFSCVKCDNWICGKCRRQFTLCPSCREDFGSSPPRRNRAVERLLRVNKCCLFTV